jgi:hypothetical protein
MALFYVARGSDDGHIDLDKQHTIECELAQISAEEEPAEAAGKLEIGMMITENAGRPIFQRRAPRVIWETCSTIGMKTARRNSRFSVTKITNAR